MNEAETRAELIDPRLKDAGWGDVDGTKILREHKITAGKIQTGGGRAKPLSADYVLVYKGRKLAVVEAKSDDVEVGEGVMQAKQYGLMLHLDFTYSSNGKEIYAINLKTGKEGLIGSFPPLTNSGRPHLPNKTIGAIPLAASLARIWAARRNCIISRRTQSIKPWPPLRTVRIGFFSPLRPEPERHLSPFRLSGSSFKPAGI